MTNIKYVIILQKVIIQKYVIFLFLDVSCNNNKWCNIIT